MVSQSVAVWRSGTDCHHSVTDAEIHCLATHTTRRNGRTFLAGLRFTYVPNTHLREFADAIHHGKLVLMADVETNQVASIGGIGWNSNMSHV